MLSQKQDLYLPSQKIISTLMVFIILNIENMKSAHVFSIKFLGFVFILSGVLKSFHIAAFSIELAEYGEFLLGIWVILHNNLIAILLCSIEILLGIYAFFPYQKSLPSLCVFILSVLFLLLTGINYLYLPPNERINNCGCFGELIVLTPKYSFYKSILLMGISVISLKNIHSPPSESFLLNRYLFYTFILCLIPPIYSFYFYDIMRNSLYTFLFIMLITFILGISYRLVNLRTSNFN